MNKKIPENYGREIICPECNILMKKTHDGIYECPKCEGYTKEGVEYGAGKNTEKEI